MILFLKIFFLIIFINIISICIYRSFISKVINQRHLLPYSHKQNSQVKYPFQKLPYYANLTVTREINLHNNNKAIKKYNNKTRLVNNKRNNETLGIKSKRRGNLSNNNKTISKYSNKTKGIIKVRPRGIPRLVGKVHIPKTAGTSFRLEVGILALSYENCYSWFNGRFPFILTFVRSPLEHIYSQFMECKHDPVFYNITKKHGFPRSDSDEKDFETWINFFYNSWNKQKDESINITTNEFRCYHPYNMQSRYLSDDCGVKEKKPQAHSYPLKPQSANFMNSSINNMNKLNFVGILEYYDASMCLFWYLMGEKYVNKMRENCFGGALHANERHNVPNHKNHTFSEETKSKALQLTWFDQILYDKSVERFFENVREFERIQKRSISHLFDTKPKQYLAKDNFSDFIVAEVYGRHSVKRKPPNKGLLKDLKKRMEARSKEKKSKESIVSVSTVIPKKVLNVVKFR